MRIQELVDKISSQMQRDSAKVRPFLVGIDGLGGSGKSTFVKSLEQELTTTTTCQVITAHLDDYIVERYKRYETGREEWIEYYALQWDVERLTNDLFKPLLTRWDTINLPL